MIMMSLLVFGRVVAGIVMVVDLVEIILLGKVCLEVLGFLINLCQEVIVDKSIRILLVVILLQLVTQSL